MIYQAMRPQTLSAMRGNKAMIASLNALLKKKEHPHVYLFVGGTGCGKTTSARIMAKEFGAAPSDIIEMNAADRTGVDDARSLAEFARMRPLSGGNRAVIIDEAALLSRNAQSALLKELEDVPRYQYYFLCSTDPQKILPTIKNRCACYEVKPLDNNEIYDLLDEAIKRFKLGDRYLEEQADKLMSRIVEFADGCPRAALQALEQVVGIENFDEAMNAILHMDVAAESRDVARAVVKKQEWAKVAALLVAMKSDNAGAESARRAMLGYFRSCLLKAPDPIKQKRYAKMVEIFSADLFASGEPGLVGMTWRALNV